VSGTRCKNKNKESNEKGFDIQGVGYYTYKQGIGMVDSRRIHLPMKLSVHKLKEEF